MKHWIVNYTARVIDGEEEELSFTLLADNISEALMLAQSRIQEMIDREEILEAVIWDIGIIEENVW